MGNLLSTIENLCLLFIIIGISCSCSSVKMYKPEYTYDYEHIECQNIHREAIDIAIADYSQRLLMHEEYSGISAVEILVACTSTDWFYVAMKPWRRNEVDKYPIATLEKFKGSLPPSWIPTEYMEENRVLYVWHNPHIALCEDVIETLAKYGLVLYPGEEWIITTDGGDMSYLFCKKNYKKKYYHKIYAPFITPLPSCRCR